MAERGRPKREDVQPLTNTRAKKAKFDPNGPAWQWIPDADVRGFGLRLYPSGVKSFAVRYSTREGKERLLTLGELGPLTVAEAREMALEAKGDVSKGLDPKKAREAARATKAITVEDLVNQWLEHRAKGQRRSWEEDQSRINRHVIPRLGRVLLDDIDGNRVESWHSDIGKKGKIEANRCVELLRAAWRWADRKGGILPSGVDDPTGRYSGGDGFKYRERDRERWLRPSETKALLERVEAEANPFIRAAIPLLLLTGLRKGELLGLRWTDVDLERSEVTLRQTKTGQPQARILPRPATDILRQLPRVQGSEWVFPSPVNPEKSLGDIKKRWRRIRRDVGLDDVTLHDLRRTAGSYMAQAGVPLQVIGEVLGHSHPGITKVYARLSDANRREALETLGKLVGDLSPGATESGTADEALQSIADSEDSEALAAALEKMAEAVRARA